MAFNDRSGRSDELIVDRLHTHLRNVCDFRQRAGSGPFQVFILNNTDAVEIAHLLFHDGNIDLVEGQPVFDFIPVTFEAGRRVFYEQIYDAAV